jgi:hypothetical protein
MEALRKPSIQTISELSLVWISLFFLISFTLTKNPEILDYGMLVRKVVRLINALLIFPLVSYQLYLFYSNQGINLERVALINLIEISFYLADGFWIFFWQKKREMDMIFHHIIGIAIISATFYLEAGLMESTFEYFAVEQSACFSMIREILKSYNQQNTKFAIIMDIIYAFSFLCTKIIMRIVLIFHYIYYWKSSKILVYINYFIQALYFYWGYNLYKIIYSKWKTGYFSFKNFQESRWINNFKKKL